MPKYNILLGVQLEKPLDNLYHFMLRIVGFLNTQLILTRQENFHNFNIQKGQNKFWGGGGGPPPDGLSLPPHPPCMITISLANAIPEKGYDGP